MRVVLWDTFRNNGTNPYVAPRQQNNKSPQRMLINWMSGALGLPSKQKMTRKPCSTMFPVLGEQLKSLGNGKSKSNMVPTQVDYCLDNAPPADAYFFIPRLENLSVTLGMIADLRRARQTTPLVIAGPLSPYLKTFAQRVDATIHDGRASTIETDWNTIVEKLDRQQRSCAFKNEKSQLPRKCGSELVAQHHRCERRFSKFPTVGIRFENRLQNRIHDVFKQTEMALELGARSVIYEEPALCEQRDTVKELIKLISNHRKNIQFSLAVDESTLRNIDFRRLNLLGLTTIDLVLTVHHSEKSRMLQRLGRQLEKQLVVIGKSLDVNVNLILRIDADCAMEKIRSAFKLAANINPDSATVQAIPLPGIQSRIVDIASAKAFENHAAPKTFDVSHIDRNCRIFRQLTKSAVDRAA